MKKLLSIYVLMSMLIFSYSCDDGVDEELFDKYVLLTENGWKDKQMEITADNKVKVLVTASISGTSANDRDVSVNVKFDPDTLQGYNFEKYRNQTGLYYSELPSAAISFDNRNISIASGKDHGETYLTLDIDQIDNKYADYVIPITIESASEYTIARDAYSKALLHVQLKNSFSGDYSGDLNVYRTNSGGGNESGDENKISVGTKSFYAISNDQCYFYAGQFSRTTADREKFIVNITIDDDGNITMDSPNPELDLKQESASIEITKEAHKTDNRYEVVITKLDLKYTFKDLSTLDKPMLRAQGAITMQQNVKIKSE
ncbi:MAG: DUF4361 domain-containing protein [Prevotella sp.]|jgi:hypothetical protein|nr:DUF4361 domain-containing protein [Prevotella sp.]